MNEWLRFDFQSINSKQRSSPTKYRVVTDDFNKMMLFIRQHGFINATPESLSVVDISDINRCPDHYNILTPYKFKSNFKDGIYTIMTTEGFVTYAIESAADDLNGCLLFGEAILRHDIEAFKTISNLISSLPHTRIFDYLLANEKCVDDPAILSSQEIASMRREYLTKINAPCEDYGAYETFESLHDSVNTDEVMPITLECYTSGFVEMMTDEYC